jgi:hypothetical protein
VHAIACIEHMAGADSMLISQPIRAIGFTVVALIATLALVAVTTQRTAASDVTLTVVGDEDAEPIHLSTATFEDAQTALAGLDEVTLSVQMPGLAAELASTSTTSDATSKTIVLMGTSAGGPVTLIAYWGDAGTPSVVFGVDAGTKGFQDWGFDGVLANYVFPRVMVYLASDSGAKSIPITALPASTLAALDGLYPGAGTDHFSLEAGLNVAATVDPEQLPDALKSILTSTDSDELLAGSLGNNDFSFLDGGVFSVPTISLSMTLPPLWDGAFPDWVSVGAATIVVDVPLGGPPSVASTRVEFQVTAGIGDSALVFDASADIDLTEHSMTFGATLPHPWVAPFGLEWLTLEATTMSMLAEQNGDITVDLSATATVAGSTVTFEIAIEDGNGVISASIDSLSSPQLAEFLRDYTGVALPSNLPEMTLTGLTFEMDSNTESAALAGTVSIFGMTGGVLVSTQRRGDERQTLLGVSAEATTLGALPVPLPGAVADIPLPNATLAYVDLADGASTEIAHGDLTVGERAFFNGVFGFDTDDEASALNLSSGLNIESSLALDALPPALVAAVGLTDEGTVTLGGSLTLSTTQVTGVSISAALPGTPSIPGLEWFQGNSAVPFTLELKYDLEETSFGVAAGFLINADGITTVPVEVAATVTSVGAVSVTGESTEPWPTPFGQEWIPTLESLSMAVEFDESTGEASSSLASSFAVGGVEISLELAIEGTPAETNVAFTGTVDEVSTADVLALIASTGAATDGLPLPDVTVRDLIISATAGTGGFSFEVGGDVTLFDLPEVGLVLSVLVEGTSTAIVVGGIKIHDVSLADIVPELDGTMPGSITAETLAMTFTVGGAEVESDDLSPVLRSFFDDIYGADEPYTVDLQTGVAMVAVIGVPTELEEVLDEFGGLTINQLLLRGMIPIPWDTGGGSIGLSLSAEIPRLEFPDGQGPDWFRHASFAIAIEVDAVTGNAELSLRGDLAVTIDETPPGGPRSARTSCSSPRATCGLASRVSPSRSVADSPRNSRGSSRSASSGSPSTGCTSTSRSMRPPRVWAWSSAATPSSASRRTRSSWRSRSAWSSTSSPACPRTSCSRRAVPPVGAPATSSRCTGSSIPPGRTSWTCSR